VIASVRTEGTIDVLERDSELADLLTDAEREAARGQLIASRVCVERGSWSPDEDAFGGDGGLGALIFDGLLLREVVVRGTGSLELLAQGDVLQRASTPPEDGLLPAEIVWTVGEPVELAVLDRDFATRAASWPQIGAALSARMATRAERMAVRQAICHHSRVDARVLALLWHLADRWGRMTVEGVTVPLRLTHDSIGRLVGAQRPSVTLALGSLSERELLHRRADGAWVLRPETGQVLDRLYERQGPTDPPRVSALPAASDARDAAGQQSFQAKIAELRVAFERQLVEVRRVRERSEAIRAGTMELSEEIRRLRRRNGVAVNGKRR
jgi:CRP/FNR family transcriptional regulator, cyclic AMP receptor protein